MKYRGKPVEAVQITDSTFDAPHPNHEHVAGVGYDPRERIARLRDGSVGLVGDWIIVDEAGTPYVLTDLAFRRRYDSSPIGTRSASWYVETVNIERPEAEGTPDQDHEIPISVVYVGADDNSVAHGAKLLLGGAYDQSTDDDIALAEQIVKTLNADPAVAECLRKIRRVAP